MLLESNGAPVDFGKMAALAAAAISLATGAGTAEAIRVRLTQRGGGAWPLAELGGQWAPPRRRVRRVPAQYDLTGTYMTINDYAKGWDDWPDAVESPASLARHILRTCDPKKLLWSLARMNALSSRIGNPPGLVDQYQEHLPEGWRPDFEEAMRVRTGGLGRIVAHRQPLLAAMRYVLTADQDGSAVPSLFPATSRGLAARDPVAKSSPQDMVYTQIHYAQVFIRLERGQ